MRVNKREVLIVVALLGLALLPRVVDLGVFLTADEKNWIGRSYEFVRAFKDWRFNDMLQTSHPGVTTLWLSGLAVTARILLGHIPFSFQKLSEFIWAAQFPIALVNALIVPAVYLLLRQLWPKRRAVAVLAAVFMALDPFLVGYSRVVHVDALLAGLLFLAALATILYVREGYARRWLVVSAILSGLAILTKAPAVFIIPFFILVVLERERWKLVKWSVIRERGRGFVLWLLIVGLIFVLLWPAMLWVENPGGNVLVLKRDLVIATATPHHMAESYTLNTSFYIYTLLTRTTPVTLILVLFVVIWSLGIEFSRRLSLAPLRRGLPPTPTPRKLIPSRPIGLLIAYVIFFVVMMTLGAKKGDRYILPVWPALDVLAAVGLVWLAGWFGKTQRKVVLVVLSVLAVGFMGFTVYSYHPYAIAYSSPLFADNLSQELGWGEGLEQVGQWLNANDPKAVVASWYPEELAAYTTASVAHINAHEQPRVHYIVLYRNMFGRPPDHYANNFIDEYFKKLEPVFVVQVHGKNYAWVYEKQTYERVVGELVPGTRVGQEVEVTGESISGVEILVATYSGRAVGGNLVISMKEKLGGKLVHQWRVPVDQLEDNKWLKVELPQTVETATVFIEVSAEGTKAGNAPTVRYSSDYDYIPSQMLLATSGQLTYTNVKDGDLAIRLLVETGE